MTERTAITAEDEGKSVVVSGQTVGRVVEVEDGTAYVAPDPGLTEAVLSTLGWASADSSDYPIDEQSVEAITDDEIRLQPTG